MTSSIKAKLNKLKNPVLSLKVPREHRHPHSLIDEENRKKERILVLLMPQLCGGLNPCGT